jgi:hypothetical protein
MKQWPEWWDLTHAMTSRSYRMCVADSSLSRHISQIGLSVNLILMLLQRIRPGPRFLVIFRNKLLF